MIRSRFEGRVAASRARSLTWARHTGLGAGLLLACGCYNYVPAEVGAVPPGEDVRVQVTRAGAEELARVMESSEIRVEVSGEYEGLQNGTLLLRIPVVRDPTGMQRPIAQVVRVPEAEVLTLDRRELSVGKTAALVGVGAAGVAVLLTRVFDVFSEGGRDGEDPDLAIVPLFRWVVGGR